MSCARSNQVRAGVVTGIPSRVVVSVGGSFIEWPRTPLRRGADVPCGQMRCTAKPGPRSPGRGIAHRLAAVEKPTTAPGVTLSSGRKESAIACAAPHGTRIPRLGVVRSDDSVRRRETPVNLASSRVKERPARARGRGCGERMRPVSGRCPGHWRRIRSMWMRGRSTTARHPPKLQITTLHAPRKVVSCTLADWTCAPDSPNARAHHRNCRSPRFTRPGRWLAAHSAHRGRSRPREPLAKLQITTLHAPRKVVICALGAWRAHSALGGAHRRLERGT